jgi:predicted house-cleaning NTP pyrophosphatase (Maf/HAM1 superfamily)
MKRPLRCSADCPTRPTVSTPGSRSLSVRFRALSDEIIRWYVATGEPMDKAGAYAIQERGALLVAGIDGSPHTVIGLPIHRLPELFARIGLDFWDFVQHPNEQP